LTKRQTTSLNDAKNQITYAYNAPVWHSFWLLSSHSTHNNESWLCEH